ncbi:MAG: pilus assembly protein N-terminal domain-containing protein, partial [Caulobacteraceae bacterium]
MRPLLLIAAVSAAAAIALPAFAAGSLNIGIDEATPVTLGGPVNNVVVGNPAVADVSVLDGRHLTVLGKGYGVTNVMAFDQGGRAVYNARVIVGPTDVGRVSVYRGREPYNYTCTGRCERNAMPGEHGPAVYNPY